MEKKGTVDVPPVVLEGVTDPRALSYAQRLQAKKPLQKYTAPAGGAPPPPIPPLNAKIVAPESSKLTMADHARTFRVGGMNLQPQPQQPQPASPSFGPPAPPAALPLHPNDILPQVASQDPEFLQGQGAMLAVNQPRLAAKYGVVRGGRLISPQELATGKSGLSEESIRGLQALNQLQQAQETVAQNQEDEEEAALRKKVDDGPAGQAARSFSTMGVRESEKKKEGPTTPPSSVMDELDFQKWREHQLHDILNNEEQRKLIESRCAPLSLDQILMDGAARQVVPIIPGQFEPEFQTMTTEDEMSIRRLIIDESQSFAMPDKYVVDRYSLMSLTAGLKAINGTQFPTHVDPEGNFNDELFLKKFKMVCRLPFQMIASLAINFFWFEARARMMFKASTIKNG